MLSESGSDAGTLYVKYDITASRPPQTEYLRFMLVIVLVSFGIAWLLSFRFQHFITGPILDLAQTTRRVTSEKNYSIRAAKRAPDELGQLYDGFNAMLAQIQERDAALQQAGRELESRVQERTRDLRQQLTRIRLLNQITHGISERHDLDSIFGVVLGQLAAHLPVDVGCVYLFKPEAGKLELIAFRLPEGAAAPTLAATSELGLELDEHALHALQQGELRSVPDLSKVTEPWLVALASAGAQSAGAVPLVAEGRLLGLLVVARRDREAFQAGEQDFLRGLSEHVALAAHQAQLHAELQKAYDEVRQSQEAVTQTERLRALGQMASGIAHDINNALSPVSGYAELLLESEKNLSSSGRKYAQLIRTASDDIAQIVSRLREFYRRRRRDEPLERVQLNQLIPEVIDLTRPRWRDIAQQLGVAVEVKAELGSDVPEVSGAASELREVLINLIFNAVDAMPQGGQVILRSRARSLAPARGGAPSPTQVIVEVQDHGVGMDEETRKRCFEPFFSTKGRRGTGLGLAMVYGVMQRHEGSIEVDTQLGHGTTMRLIFPARSATDMVKAPEPVVAPSKPPLLRILFVDDEPLLRELIREILETDGHTVQTADGGQSGLEAFRTALREKQPFDVVITDLGMPHMDGRQLTALLKKESPTTPVVMMTGWGALMKGETEIHAPVDGLVNKPPKIRELQEVLARVIAARAPS
jgi:signal transduction histidine kinase/ActR/RegA family two-component response regulator